MTRQLRNAAVNDLLTDGAGVSRLTSSKLVKDLVADFLITFSAALVGSNVAGVADAFAAPQLVLIAGAGAMLHTIYRGLLKWSTTP